MAARAAMPAPARSTIGGDDVGDRRLGLVDGGSRVGEGGAEASAQTAVAQRTRPGRPSRRARRAPAGPTEEEGDDLVALPLQLVKAISAAGS